MHTHEYNTRHTCSMDELEEFQAVGLAGEDVYMKANIHCAPVYARVFQQQQGKDVRATAGYTCTYSHLVSCMHLILALFVTLHTHVRLYALISTSSTPTQWKHSTVSQRTRRMHASLSQTIHLN